MVFSLLILEVVGVGLVLVMFRKVEEWRRVGVGV